MALREETSPEQGIGSIVRLEWNDQGRWQAGQGFKWCLVRHGGRVTWLAHLGLLGWFLA